MLDLELRKKCISSTDIGPIFGVDDWRDGWTVAAYKQGLIPAETPNFRMRLGKAIESLIVVRYAELIGKEVTYFDQTVVHPTRQWMSATPDALICGEKRGVDAKYVHWDQRRKWGASCDEVPLSVQFQMWWMMAVCEYDTWDVAAVVGEDEPRIYTFLRDREAERVMIERAEEFHRRYVIGKELPPIGGSDAAQRWLQQAFPTHRTPDIRQATDEEAYMLDAYVRLRCELRNLSEEKDELENRLRAAVADSEGLAWPDGKFTWRKTKDSAKTDWKSLALGLMRLLPEEEAQMHLELHTARKEGSRRIWLDSDSYRDSAREVAA